MNNTDYITEGPVTNGIYWCFLKGDDTAHQVQVLHNRLFGRCIDAPGQLASVWLAEGRLVLYPLNPPPSPWVPESS